MSSFLEHIFNLSFSPEKDKVSKIKIIECGLGDRFVLARRVGQEWKTEFGASIDRAGRGDLGRLERQFQAERLGDAKQRRQARIA